MTTEAFSAGLTLKRGDGATPTEVFTTIEEVVEMGEVGKTNEETEVTNFSSPAGSKEFIAALAEGDTIDITCNRRLSNNTEQQGLISDVNNRVTRNFELDIDNGTNVETVSFSLAMLGFKYGVSLTDANTITFSGKITGAVTSAIA